MPTTIYDSKKESSSSSLIPNTIIERMFMSICDDEQMKIYVEKAQSQEPAIRASATAYASAKVERTFQYFRDTFIKTGGDMEYLQFMLWRKSK